MIYHLKLKKKRIAISILYIYRCHSGTGKKFFFMDIFQNVLHFIADSLKCMQLI